MATLVSLIDEKEAVLFEADVSQRQLQEIGVVDDLLEGITGRLGNIGTAVRLLVQELTDSIHAAVEAAVRPLSKAELELGLKVDGEGRVFVAKGSIGANITVRLTWKPGE
jgi:hypothetical protein